MGEENRLLSDEEIMALPDGARLYTEERTHTFLSEYGTKEGSTIEGDRCGRYEIEDDGWGGWRKMSANGPDDVRAWLREPTAAELAANPWPDTKEE